MLLADTDASLLEDGTLRFQVPGWPRSAFLLSPWERGFATRIVRGRESRPGVAWPIVIVPDLERRASGNPDVDAFVERIPLVAARLVAPYRFGQSLLLAALAALQGVVEDLAESNANLLWLLAYGVYEGRIAPDDVGALCRLKQAETLRVLTGAGSKAQVRFLRKVRIEEGTLSEARLVFDSVRDQALVHALRHVQRVPIELLSVLATHPRLAHEELVPIIAVKLAECENGGPAGVRQLHRALRNLAAARAAPQARQFRAALEESLRALEAPPRLVRAAFAPPAAGAPERPAAQSAPAVFPPPPLPGTSTIVPIATVEELEEEGRLQRNCAAGFVSRICAGAVYLYRVLAPERATLEIVLSGRKPRLGELKLSCNRKPSAASRRAVKAWLEAATRAAEGDDSGSPSAATPAGPRPAAPSRSGRASGRPET